MVRRYDKLRRKEKSGRHGEKSLDDVKMIMLIRKEKFTGIVDNLKFKKRPRPNQFLPTRVS